LVFEPTPSPPNKYNLLKKRIKSGYNYVTTSPETNDGADFGHENGEEDADDDNASVEDDDLPVAGEHGAIDRVENGNPAHKRRHFNQDCGSVTGWIRIQSGQWIRIRIRNPHPDPGGKKWPTKAEKKFKSSCFEVLDGLF
jgi:hypothetical protein